MTRSKTRVLLLVVALALGAALLLSAASVASAPGAASQAPQSNASGSQKIIKTRFAVMNMLYQSIQVRGLMDMREIHIFTYSPEIRDKMQKIFNAGGYHYGDKVEVWYRPGDTVALRIKGKPSKPK